MRVTTSSLPNGAIKSGYSSGLVASGGVAPYLWKAVGGTVPPGLALSASTGMISGTPSTTGKYVFTVEATDSSTKPKTALRGLSITIGADAALLSISSSSLPNGELKVSYASSVNANGGSAPYTWSVSSGSLPAGLSLNASTGAISGMPTTSGAFPFSLSVKDSSATQQSASQSLTIAVETTVQITTSSLPSGTTKSQYSAVLGAQGGLAPYSWRMNSGSLPAGLTLSQAGTVSGMPTQTGNTSFSVLVTDSSSIPQTTTQSLNVNVQTTNSAPAPLPLSISTSGVVNGITSQTYSGFVTAGGGTSPYTYAVTGGSLPAGLSMNSSTGAVTGSPAATGTFPFTVQVKDSSASQQTASAGTSVVIVGPLQITTTSLPAMQAQSSVNATINISGGMSPFAFGVTSGSLPAGLSLNSSTGVISGAPSAAGEYRFTVQVTDPPSLPQAASQTFAGNVATTSTPSSLQITTTSLAGGQVQTSYSATLAATGGTQPYTWSISSGSLNAGLTLSAGGQILGTLTASGSSAFTVKVTDANSNTATQALSIGVGGLVTITTASLPGATQGVAYSMTMGASGGTAPYSWSVTSGSLPAGLALGSSGTVSGSPSATGTFAIGVQVADSNGNVATQNFNLVVSTPVAGMPAQFTGLMTCTQNTGNCAAQASPSDLIPPPYDGTPATVYTDPVFGTKIYRLTPQGAMGSCGYKPIYSTTQSWNADESLLMLTVYDSSNSCFTGGAGVFLFCGANTGGSECSGFGIAASHYQFIEELPASLAGGDGVDEWDGVWDNSDRCSLYYWYVTTLYKVNVCTNSRTVMMSPSTVTDTQGNPLTLATACTTAGAGQCYIKKRVYCSITADSTKMGVVVYDGNGNDYGFGVVSIPSGGFLWFHKLTSPGDWVNTNAPSQKSPAWHCIDPTGTYTEAPLNTPPTGYTHTGTEVFDAATGAYIGYASTPWTSFGHGDVFSQDNGLHQDTMYLADGINTGVVSQFGQSDCGDSNSYRRWALYPFNATSLGCSPSFGSIVNNQMISAAYGFQWHVSGRGSYPSVGLPGWALASTYEQISTADESPDIPYDSEIDAVKMDGSNLIVRIAHDQGCTDDTTGTYHQYFSEPHATVSRTFTKILFGSLWWPSGACNVTGTMPSGDSVNAYIVELP